MEDDKPAKKVRKKRSPTINKRPPHYPSASSRATVKKMFHEGRTVKEMADALNCNPISFRRIYGKELEGFEHSGSGANDMYQINDKHRREVEGMVLAGIHLEDVARAIGVSSITLRRYYRDELENVKNKRLGRIAYNLYDYAETTSPTNHNAFFILRARGGWRETDEKELSLNFSEVMKEIAAKLPD